MIVSMPRCRQDRDLAELTRHGCSIVERTINPRDAGVGENRRTSALLERIGGRQMIRMLVGYQQGGNPTSTSLGRAQDLLDVSGENWTRIDDDDLLFPHDVGVRPFAGHWRRVRGADDLNSGRYQHSSTS